MHRRHSEHSEGSVSSIGRRNTRSVASTDCHLCFSELSEERQNQENTDFTNLSDCTDLSLGRSRSLRHEPGRCSGNCTPPSYSPPVMLSNSRRSKTGSVKDLLLLWCEGASRGRSQSNRPGSCGTESRLSWGLIRKIRRIRKIRSPVWSCRSSLRDVSALRSALSAIQQWMSESVASTG